MRLNIKKYFIGLGLIASVATLNSCNKFLDRTPLDAVTPADYLKSEVDLAAYSLGAYAFSTPGLYTYNAGPLLTSEGNTDNFAVQDASLASWLPGFSLVPNESAAYSWNAIRNINYFFDLVLPRQEKGELTGSTTNINHYIGEMYFLRAYQYFAKLKTYGDFPIVKTVLPDDAEQLILESQRRPRNEVARFIIEDLDKAISLLQGEFENKNRITKNVAQLFKSRVALYEASWLTYHKGTAFVPGGNGWPGAKASYNQGYNVDLDAEIKFFLDAAATSAKVVADGVQLVNNNSVMNPSSGNYTKWNPYFEMFSDENMSTYSEVLMWRDYSTDANVLHGIPSWIYQGSGYGVTKGGVDAFLMKNGLPIYAAGSGYQGDNNLDIVKKDRDERLQLFVFGSSDLLITSTKGDTKYEVPTLFEQQQNNDVTGYRFRKYYNYDPANGGAGNKVPSSQTGYIVFRAVEAYLNYMEAVYMRDGALDASAKAYWAKIRERAGVDTDFEKTIANTDLSKENDWGVYSAGAPVDATLYNIRRERRTEMFGEGIRWDDLKRWRALDQVKNYIIQGVNFWTELCNDPAIKDGIIVPGGSKTATVSAESDGVYLCPHRVVTKNNDLFNGLTWSTPNYLSPLPALEILLTAETAEDGEANLESSPLYQNPYWPSVADQPATGY